MDINNVRKNGQNVEKRVCKNFTTGKKIEILKELDTGASISEISLKYSIDETSVRRWKRNRLNLEECNQENNEVKRIRKNPNEILTKSLYVWFQNLRARNLPISGPIIKGIICENCFISIKIIFSFF